MPLTPLAAGYDQLLLDLDGCLWVGDEPTPGAREAVEALRAAGKGVAFVTNDARHAPEDVVRRLWSLGFRASLEEVVTVGAALQFTLHERHSGQSAFVVGAPALHRHVVDAGLRVVNGTAFASRADVVVLAQHEGFGHEELKLAIQAALRGAALVGAGRDPTFPMPDGPWPGHGTLVAAVEEATGRRVTTVGKPEPALFLTAVDRLGAGRALAVGDRLDADADGARAAGIDAAIVLTGATDAEEAHRALAGDEAAAAVAGEDRPGPRLVAVADTLAGLVLGRS